MLRGILKAEKRYDAVIIFSEKTYFYILSVISLENFELKLYNIICREIRKERAMQIIENQTISVNNLIDYNSKIQKKDILNLIHFISDHLYVLGLEQNGNIMFSLLADYQDEADFEIFIPVKGTVQNCDEFGYQPEFSLENAISGRHEGSLASLGKAAQKLKNYISSNNYEPVTKAYYSVIREGTANAENCIIDIYIGIKK